MSYGIYQIERGTDGLVKVGECLGRHKDTELKNAQNTLGQLRIVEKTAGRDPYNIVLLPDGKGGPYLPIGV
jgi:hypothetical protein